MVRNLRKRTLLAAFSGVLWWLNLPGAAMAQAVDGRGEAPAPEARETFSLRTSKRLLGNWGGERTRLEESGVKFNFVLGSTTSMVFRGGLNTKNTIENGGRGFYIFDFDLGKMGLVPGGSVFVRILQEWGEGVRAEAGALSDPYSSLCSTGPDAFKFDKWWYKQRLFDGRLEFRLGKLLTVLDLFGRNAYAGSYLNQFSNRALNYSPAVPCLRGLGAYVRVQPVDWFYVAAMGVDPYFNQTSCSHGFNGFDTAFGKDAHFLGLGEIGVKVKIPSAAGALPGTYRVGGWYDPRVKEVFFDTLEGRRAVRRESGDTGFYFNFDQLLWREGHDASSRQGLGVFARYSYADDDVNAVSRFWSAGAVYTGLLPERDADVIGFGVAQSLMSKQLRREINALADRETVYELYYAIKVTPWLTVTPDVQVITNPGGDKDARDALVGGVRFKIVF